MLKSWVINNLNSRNHRVLVVNFEDLKLDTASQVKRMLEFLHISYTNDDLKQKLMEGYGAYHRNHHKEDFEYYTPELKQYVYEGIRSTLHLVQQHGTELTLHLKDYLTKAKE